MATKVINIKSGQSYDIYCGRAGKGQDGYFGNPFKLPPNELRGTTLFSYKQYFLKRLEIDPIFKQRVLELKDKTLGCFCKPHPCHVDIIIEWLNNQ